MQKPSRLVSSVLAFFALVGIALFTDGTIAADGNSNYQIRESGSQGQGKWADDAAFVVIGSFQTERRAKQLAEQRAAWNCKILQAEVKGRTQYRVALGPFPKEVVQSAVSRASASGINDVWLLPAKTVGDNAKVAGQDSAG